MADNVVANAGLGGETFATDDDGTAHHAYTKLEYGANNTYTKVAVDAPLPVGHNTVKDGSGTLLAPLVDADGHAQGDILSVVPGVAATSLGKAEDAVHASGDVGVMALSVRQDDADTVADADGDYAPLSTSEHGCLNVDAQHYYEIDDCNTSAGWTVLNDDAGNITTDTSHVFGTASLEFDKLNGGSDTKLAVIQKSIGPVSLNKHIEEGGGFVLWAMNIPSLTNVDYVFIRLGTDSTNYNEWEVQDDNLTAGVWQNLRAPLTAPNAVAGNGWNSAVVAYVAVGVAFDVQTNMLADILADAMFINSGFQTTSDITSQVTSEVSSPNVNVKKWGSQTVDLGNGSVGTGTLRVTVADDSTGIVAVTSVPAPLNVVGGGTEAAALRVTMANNSTGTMSVTNDGTFVVQEDGALLTAAQLIDDTVYVLGTATYAETTSKGNLIAVVRNDALAALADTDNELAPLQVNATGALYTVLTAGSATIGKLAANTGVDIGDVDVTSGPTGATAFAVQGTVASGDNAANNPVLLGVKAGNAQAAAVDDTDVIAVAADLNGQLINTPFCPPEKLVSGTTAFTEYTDVNNHVILTNPDGGERFYITHFSAENADGTDSTPVLLKDEDDNALAVIYARKEGGGASLTFNPPLRVAAVNKDVEVECEVAAEIYVTVAGYLGR